MGDSVMEKLRKAHAIHNPLAANRLILFTRHQAPGQSFEEYHADLFWVYNRCDVATLTDMKLFSYLMFMGIRDDDLREAVVTRVKGDDSQITVELMLEVAKTRTTLHAYKEMVAQKDSNVVAYTTHKKRINLVQKQTRAMTRRPCHCLKVYQDKAKEQQCTKQGCVSDVASYRPNARNLALAWG